MSNVSSNFRAVIKYATVCSGIGAPEYAWTKLGWQCAWQSEIEPFPCAVLKHHYPNTPNLGDMTALTQKELQAYGKIDLICGGTPCQAFSVAGLRKGLDDPRGNLALVYLRLIEQTRPTWVVWENVPGVLSSSKGRDFGAFLGALGQLGYGWAYRVLDAQYFGVPQTRRRVFLVGCNRGWQNAAAVLFERETLQRTIAEDKAVWKGCKGSKNSIASSAQNSKHARLIDYLAHTFSLHAATLSAMFLVANKTYKYEQMGTLCASAPGILFVDKRNNAVAISSHVDPIWHTVPFVRYLTPVECERLQGFPDHYTRISYKNTMNGMSSARMRWKALGNSIAVPVLAWLGQRLQAVHEIITSGEVAT